MPVGMRIADPASPAWNSSNATMKITPEHYAHMKAAIEPLADQIPSRREAITAEGKAHDVEVRLRWDLCYAAGLGLWICDNLYGYMNDAHIDTALRGVMREVGADPEPDRGMRMG